MENRRSPQAVFWVRRGLLFLAVGLAALNLAGLLVLMLIRARYPFELEWIEGAAVNSSQWILSGHFLYEQPRLEFTPLLYGPLFFYLSAALTALVGPGFLAARLVSILATVGCWLVIFALVRRETNNVWAGIMAAGFYAATFKVTGVWMDVARSDSLLVFFLLLAAYTARRAPSSSRISALGCAAILALAYFSKQSALPFFVAFGGFYLLESKREWVIFWPAAVVLTVGTTWLIDALSGGWFSFYTWYVVRQTVLDVDRIRAFWTMDLLGHVPLALVGAVGALLLLRNPFRISPEGSRSRFYLAFTAGALAASWWNRAAAGAHTNTLMPIMACLGILLGLTIGLPKPACAWLQPITWLLIAAQFLILLYDPRTVLPSARDERAGRDLLALIRSYPGEVFIPAHSYYAALVGKPTYVHWATITDTSGLWDTDLDVQHGGKNDPRRQIILDEIQAAVASQRFDAIILDDIPKELKAYWNDLLAPYYRLERRVFAEPDVFWTISGAAVRPQLVYVRKR